MLPTYLLKYAYPRCVQSKRAFSMSAIIKGLDLCMFISIQIILMLKCHHLSPLQSDKHIVVGLGGALPWVYNAGFDHPLKGFICQWGDRNGPVVIRRGWTLSEVYHMVGWCDYLMSLQYSSVAILQVSGSKTPLFIIMYFIWPFIDV